MTNANSGTSSLTGYIYQKRVSVLLALDIVAASKTAQRLVLEPVSEEDLEAEIENEVDAAAATAKLNGYQLVVQCKFRSTGPFGVADVKRLLAHGTVRMKPKDRLNASPNVRYLLITNADLSGEARKLAVEVGEWPRAVPASLKSELGENASSRVGILSVLDNEKLRGRINTFLSTRFKVPDANIENCIQALESAALARMLGQNAGIWARAEIEQVLEQFGGFTGTSEALEGYVRPTNWDDLSRKLDEQHAVVIVGASGTGKTRASKALLAELQQRSNGLEVIYVNGGPEIVLASTAGRRVAFEIEDPWGRYRLSPHALPWNDALPQFLHTASADRKYVVTSRSDILREAMPRDVHDRWFVSLEEENYGDLERAKLFNNRLGAMSRPIQNAAFSFRNLAIERLHTPLEMERFFANLLGGRRDGETEPDYVTRCIHEAHHTSIEQALVNGIRHRQAWSLAAIVWGLFKAQPKLQFEVMPLIQSGLSERDPAFDDQLQPFLHFLIAGRNLRQAESVISFQHPRVEMGLEEALLEKPGASSRALKHLLSVLVEADKNGADDWGREAAALLMAAVTQHDSLSVTIRDGDREAIDRWLEVRLQSEEAFGRSLDLAAKAGSAASDVAELARWLLHSPRTGRDWSMYHTWAAPERSENWYDRISNNPAARSICERFVEKQLPRRDLEYPDNFHELIGKFGFDLAPSFLAAAKSIVYFRGFNSNDDAILEGAITNLSAFEAVVVEAAKHEREVNDEYSPKMRLAVANGEYDRQTVEHYSESLGEDTITSGGYLRRYVQEVRALGEFNRLATHADLDELLWSWIGETVRTPPMSDEEALVLAAAARGHRHEHYFWESIEAGMPQPIRELLTARLVDGSDDFRSRRALLQAACSTATDALVAAFEKLVSSNSAEAMLVYAADFRSLLQDEVVGLSADVVRPLADVMPTGLANAFLAIVDLDALNDMGRGVIERSTLSTPQLQLACANLLHVRGENVSSLIAAILASENSDDDDFIGLAVKATELADQLGYDAILEQALLHRFADVREVALVGLASRMEGELPAKLLALASDKGSRVRRRLLGLVKKRQGEANFEVIMTLLNDKWSDSDGYNYENPDYPVAVEAANALLSNGRKVNAELRTRLGRSIRDSEDTQVKLLLIRVMVRHGDEETLGRVLSMASGSGSPPLHRLSAQALFLERESVSAALVDAIQDTHLNGRPPENACYLCLLLGARGSEDRVLLAAGELASNPDRRAMLTVIALGAVERDGLPEQVLKLLPKMEGEAIASALTGGDKISPEIIDGLADIRVATELKKRWLKDYLLDNKSRAGLFT